MSDWQVGDLALCVKGGKIDRTALHTEAYPVAGHIYSVAHVGYFKSIWGLNLSLLLSDGPLNTCGRAVWIASRFIRITPGAKIEGFEEPRRITVKHEQV